MTRAITPLRQRMIDDMRLRKLAPKTPSAYLLHVRRLVTFLHRPPQHRYERGFATISAAHG